MNDWIDFYDSAHSIYVSPRHRDIHFRVIAEELAALVGSPSARVIDYSCGEALSAERVAQACGELILAEPAPSVRDRLAHRFQDKPGIIVRSLDDLTALPPRSVDVVIMNSVAQYMAPDELDGAFGRIHGLLKPDGRFILGDIVQPGTGPLTDAGALLRFAASHGFLKDAMIGLVRTVLSDYRQTRERLGFSQYSEADMLAKLAAAGFRATRATKNIGHNPARMTFIAEPA